MRKIIALLLAVSALFTFIACGTAKQDETTAQTSATTAQTEGTTAATEATTATAGYVSPTENTEIGDYTAQTLCELFLSLVKAYPDETPEQIAARYLEDKWFENKEMEVYSETYPEDYMPFVMGLTESFEIPHYASVTHVSPFMFPNTYVSHAFVLDDGTDADAFCKALMDNTDLAFNVCVVSSDCYADHVGNIVFYVIR